MKTKKPRSTHADVLRARDSFDRQRAINEARGQEVLLVVVGYASGREPFRLLGRVSCDTGEPQVPVPELTQQDMQPVAYAAKMAFMKVLIAKRKAKR